MPVVVEASETVCVNNEIITIHFFMLFSSFFFGSPNNGWYSMILEIGLYLEVPRIPRSKALIVTMYQSKPHPRENCGKATSDTLENLRTYAAIALQL
jgi:hypothetical protein